MASGPFGCLGRHVTGGPFGCRVAGGSRTSEDGCRWVQHDRWGSRVAQGCGPMWPGRLKMGSTWQVAPA